MQYDPVKKTLGRFFSGSLFLRKTFYFCLDILLLRTWHVKKALHKTKLPDKEVSILDAGCGFGQYTWRLCKMNSSWKITAVDIDNEHITDCESFFSKAGLAHRTDFRTVDLTSFDDTDKYNLILSVDVMEHIEDDISVFRNFHRALRENGTLVISTPSDKGGSDVHNEGEHSFIGEHVRDGYSIEDITGKLKSAGFRTVSASYTYGLPGTISWRLTMKYPIQMLNISYLFFLILPVWYIVFLPLSLILNYMDVKISHKEGTGLLVTASK